MQTTYASILLIAVASNSLGGVMVWAVSHDTSDATFSEALRKQATLSSPSLTSFGLVSNGVVSYDRVKKFGQCMWANCGECK